MQLNRLIALIIFLLIGSTAYGLFNDMPVFVFMGHIFTLPMVGLWYGFKRKWQSTPIDLAVYLAFLVGSFTDSIILIGGQIGEELQIIITIIMHTILIVIFRKEGSRIYSDKLHDLPKLLIPITIVFVFFGVFMIPILPNTIYFIAIFYAIQEMLLVSHGLFRPVKGNSYRWIAIGVCLSMIKDVLYSYNFFVFGNKIISLYIIEYSLSTTVYFMIAVGIALNQDKKNLKIEESLWQYIKNHIKLLFNFHHLTHTTSLLFKLNQFIISKVKLYTRNFLNSWYVYQPNK
jgi:hypothetical protein